MRTLLVVALLMAGCTAPVAPPSDPCLVEAAEDAECQDGEAAGGDRPHLHDYWGGRDERALEEVTETTGGTLCTGEAQLVVLRPADGDTIIQGSRNVSVTITFDIGSQTSMGAEHFLFVKTAADNDAREIGAFASGDTVILPSTNEQNDLPHQRLSAWEFRIIARPTDELGCYTWNGPFTMQLVLERGHEIPLYTGHPDPWHSDPLPILEESHSTSLHEERLGMCLAGPGHTRCLWNPFVPANGSIIPNDALVVIHLEVDGTSPLRLFVHGGDTREFEELHPTSPGVYELLAAGAGDGPYAKQSLWEFLLVPDEPQVFSGSFTLTVEAKKA